MAATEITKQTMEIRKTKKQRELNTWKCVRIPLLLYYFLE